MINNKKAESEEITRWYFWVLPIIVIISFILVATWMYSDEGVSESFGNILNKYIYNANVFVPSFSIGSLQIGGNIIDARINTSINVVCPEEEVTFSCMSSILPEGHFLKTCSWDFNTKYDTDGDGDPANDGDKTDIIPVKYTFPTSNIAENHTIKLTILTTKMITDTATYQIRTVPDCEDKLYNYIGGVLGDIDIAQGVRSYIRVPINAIPKQLGNRICGGVDGVRIRLNSDEEIINNLQVDIVGSILEADWAHADPLQGIITISSNNLDRAINEWLIDYKDCDSYTGVSLSKADDGFCEIEMRITAQEKHSDVELIDVKIPWEKCYSNI